MPRNLTLLILGLLWSAPNISASHRVHAMRTNEAGLVCTRATSEEIHRINESRTIRNLYRKGPRSHLDTYRTRQIKVSFSYDFPEEAKDPFRQAVSIWDSYLLIEVPVKIKALLADDPGEDTVAYASSWVGCMDDYCVEASLMNQILGRDKDRRNPEFEIYISDSEDWHYGLDGNPPEETLDLLSVILHEFAHGFGFSSGISKSEGWEDAESPIAEHWELKSGNTVHFDDYVWTWDYGRASDLDSPSTDLYESISNYKLFWGHSGMTNSRGEPLRSITANGGPIMLWADPDADSGSVVSHLDKHAYPWKSPNGMMAPYIYYQEVHHDAGPVVLGMLHDLGWELQEQAVELEDVLRCLGEE